MDDVVLEIVHLDYVRALGDCPYLGAGWKRQLSELLPHQSIHWCVGDEAAVTQMLAEATFSFMSDDDVLIYMPTLYKNKFRVNGSNLFIGWVQGYTRPEEHCLMRALHALKSHEPEAQ